MPNSGFEPIGCVDALIRLATALGLGMLIGIEREILGRPAGLRTHGIVSLGSALFTMISASFVGPNSDPARIAAQIVTGVGFLGAGTIMRHGSMVRGLTTAANIWVAAAIGMACGMAWYPAALATTVFALIALVAIRPLAVRLSPGMRRIVLHVTGRTGDPVVAEIARVAQHHGAVLASVRIVGEEPPDLQHFEVELQLQPGTNPDQIIGDLAQVEILNSVERAQ